MAGRQQVNTALLELPACCGMLPEDPGFGDPSPDTVHLLCLGAPPHAPQESKRSCKHLSACVKLQHQVKCFICFLKSQLCSFYTILNMNV